MTNSKQSLAIGLSIVSGRKKACALGVAFVLWSLLIYVTRAPLVMAQIQNGISSPEEGSSLSGIVSIQGTATDDQFLRYEMAFSSGGDWLVFAESDRPIVNGTLAIWDTTVGQPTSPVFPDGVYQLRLRVVRQDYNYDEFFVRNLSVDNAMTPTPTGTGTPEAGGTRALGTQEPQVTTTSGFIIVRPTALPSLTPFPTPSSAPVSGIVEAGTPVASGERAGDGEGGLLRQVQAIDTSRFSRAFMAGVRLAFYAFVLLAVYILLRAVIRYLLPRFWSRVNRQE